MPSITFNADAMGRGSNDNKYWETYSTSYPYSQPAQGGHYDKWNGTSQWGEFLYSNAGASLNIDTVNVTGVYCKIHFMSGGWNRDKPINLQFMAARTDDARAGTYKPTVRTVLGYNGTRTLSWLETENIQKFVNGWKRQRELLTQMGQSPNAFRICFYNGETYTGANGDHPYSNNYARMDSCELTVTYGEKQVVRIWNGSAWQEHQPFYWDGENWIPCMPKIWDGSAWKDCQ